mmetsp:Transcript_30134/g.50698  ORF Transcript_30134/g.50698 Transcript_30134/m.50698 type:complete len:278 (-) Transcript_30134:347-1180(-)
MTRQLLESELRVCLLLSCVSVGRLPDVDFTTFICHYQSDQSTWQRDRLDTHKSAVQATGLPGLLFLQLMADNNQQLLTPLQCSLEDFTVVVCRNEVQALRVRGPQQQACAVDVSVVGKFRKISLDRPSVGKKYVLEPSLYTLMGVQIRVHRVRNRLWDHLLLSLCRAALPLPLLRGSPRRRLLNFVSRKLHPWHIPWSWRHVLRTVGGYVTIHALSLQDRCGAGEGGARGMEGCGGVVTGGRAAIALVFHHFVDVVKAVPGKVQFPHRTSSVGQTTV